LEDYDMTTTGIDQVVGRLKLALEDAKNEKTERAITAMLISGGANASALTPIDSSALINSQGRQTWPTDSGYAGAVYYGAHYAGYVHEMPGKLKGRPRNSVTSFTAYRGTANERLAFSGNQGNFWDPDAEPHFLKKGMEEMAADATVILESIYAVN
jgi:hypothetical protein